MISFLSSLKNIKNWLLISSLGKINGLNALIDVLKNNICKIQILINVKDEEYSKGNQFLKESFATVWSWSKKYLKKKATNILESNTAELLENFDKKVSEWNKNSENTEVEE